MYGTALIDLYSSCYNEPISRKSSNTNDGNGNSSTILKSNKKATIVKDTKLSGLCNLLFDSGNQSDDCSYHTLSDYPRSELLVNINEEEAANDESKSTDRKRRTNVDYKSSSDGCKIKPFINQKPTTSSSMQVNNSEMRHSTSLHQIDFGRVIARFPMIYVGQKFLDKKYTLPMLPWLISEFRREVLPIGACSPNSGSNSSGFDSGVSLNSFSLINSPCKKERNKIWFEITDRCILGFDRDHSGFEQLSKSLNADSETKAFSRMNVLNEGYLFLHKNNWICKIQAQQHEEGDFFSFAYLTRDFGSGFGQNNESKPYTLHIFECDYKQIMTDTIEIIKQINPDLQCTEELGVSSADSLLPKNVEQISTGSVMDNILGNSQQYEVFYSGKLRVAHKITSPSFIDETVNSWKQAKTTGEQDKKSDDISTYKSSDKTSIPILSIGNKTLNSQTQAAGQEEHPHLKPILNSLGQSIYQTNNLHLQSNHSLITNTQSLDESTKETILNDLKKVNKQQQLDLKGESTIQLSSKADHVNQNLNAIADHLLTDNLNELGEIKRSSSAKVNTTKLKLCSGIRLRSASGEACMSQKQVSLPLYGRPRTRSGGSSDFNRRQNSILQLRAKNRTMLFLIGRFEICLLSLDNQQILLRKSFNSVTHCSQGVNYSDHFGFVCKEQKNIFSIYSNCKLMNDRNINSSSSSCLNLLEFDEQYHRISSSSLASSFSEFSSNDLITTELENQYQYVAYIFKGENEKLVNEIMYSLKQAFRNAHHAIQQSKTKNNVFCQSCPLRYFNQLCISLQDASVEKAQCVILNKIGELTTSEQKEIMSGYEGVQVNSIKEQNEILMSLLKRFYEKRQLKHPVCKSTVSSTHPNLKTYSLDVFRQRAKKSLSTSFETITSIKTSLKNNAHENRFKHISNSDYSFPNYESEDKENNLNFINQPIAQNRTSIEKATKQRSLPIVSVTDQQQTNPNKGLFGIFMKIGTQNKSSEENSKNSSCSSLPTFALNNNSVNQSRSEFTDKESDHEQASILKQKNRNSSIEKTIEFSSSATLITPKLDEQEISLDSDEGQNKIYDSNDQEYVNEEKFEENLVSWRKQIFSSIQTSSLHLELSSDEMKSQAKSVTFDSGGLITGKTRKRTREEFRELWRKAIHQQILLIKMEKENLLLKENQHEAEDKRLKLNYKDVFLCTNNEKWCEILARCDEYARNIPDELLGNFDCFGNTQNYNLTKYSFLKSAVTPSEFAEAMQTGCPKARRGEIWYLLAEIRQRNGVRPICSRTEASVDFETNYRVLLQQLTSQQHAILVDLGRTFPKHPYFEQSLGSGQLCLYNLLKAYSLFDKEVGYCQGLSFVAGILLIHMSEDDAFEMMKHLLFFLGLRKQYKPDMTCLQMQFYQLTRLLYDHHRDIYEHFEKYDISPVLYAAPWFLTLFASQFPISVVSRLFDFIFLFGLEAIFRVSLSLLAIHKQSLLKCTSFESIIYFLKNDLVDAEISQLETMFNIAFALDITRQLSVYEIEYQVIQEEMQYQPLAISYDRFKTANEQPSSKNKTGDNLADKADQSNASNLNHTKVRKISCGAIQEPPSLYHHLKQRKISSTMANTSHNVSADHQTNEKLKELEKENKNLKNRNMEILDQLHVAQSSVYSLESSLDSYKSTVRLLERRVRALEDERDVLLHMVAK